MKLDELIKHFRKYGNVKIELYNERNVYLKVINLPKTLDTFDENEKSPKQNLINKNILLTLKKSIEENNAKIIEI